MSADRVATARRRVQPQVVWLASVAFGLGVWLAQAPSPTVRVPQSAAPASQPALAPVEGARSFLCAVPPAPGKRGFQAAMRYAPDPHRHWRLTGSLARGDQPDTVRAIGVLVDFEDEPMDSTRAYFERVLFHQNQFWSQVSGGKLTIRATLTDSVYRMPETQAFYGEDELFGERQTLFVRDAIGVADADVNYVEYDAVFCIHAGDGQEADVAGDSPEQLWSVFVPLEAMEFFLPDSTAAQGVATDDVDNQGNPHFVEMALVLPENESQDLNPQTGQPYSFGMLGVYAHEFGHVLGLPDLYDTTPEEFPDSQGIGSFGVMGGGTWNFNGFVPAAPCMWSKYELGFVDPLIVTSEQVVTLSAATLGPPGPVAALVPLGGDEYFLIENRFQDADADSTFDFYDADGDSLFTLYDLEIPADQADSYTNAEFDYFLPGEGQGSGLLIWHVDPSVLREYGRFNAVQHDPEHKGVDLEEADAIEDLDVLPGAIENFGSAGDAFRAGHAATFGPATIPNTRTSYGAPSFVTIDQISEPGPTMSFRVRFEEDGALPRRKPGFSPVPLVGPVKANHLVAAEVAGPGSMVIAAVDSLGNVYAVDAAGRSPYSGGDAAIPLASIGLDARTVPALVDLDGDGGRDLVVCGPDGRLWAWDGDSGEELLDGDGAPQTRGVLAQLPGRYADTVPVSVPRAGGGGDMVFVGSRVDSVRGESWLTWLTLDGIQAIVQSVALPGDLAAPPLVLTEPTRPELGAVWVVVATIDAGGRSRFFEVWPLFENGRIIELERDRAALQNGVRSLVAGDMEGDGVLDIVATDDHGRIERYAYARSGAESGADILANAPRLVGQRGWPFELGLGVAHDVSVADVDADGLLEVLLAALDGRIYALNFNGTPQQGFPCKTDWVIRPLPGLVPAPMAFRLTGASGRQDLVVAAGDGRLLVVDATGEEHASMALPGPAGEGAQPIVADLEGDGTLDVVVPSDLGGQSFLMAYELATATPGAAWPAYRGGAARRGIQAPPGQPAPGSIAEGLVEAFYVYPNPVDGPTAHIHFALAEDASVSITITDARGRVVAEPAAPAPAPGATEHVVAWSVADQPSGLYVLTLEVQSAGRLFQGRRTVAVRR